MKLNKLLAVLCFVTLPLLGAQAQELQSSSQSGDQLQAGEIPWHKTHQLMYTVRSYEGGPMVGRSFSRLRVDGDPLIISIPREAQDRSSSVSRMSFDVGGTFRFPDDESDYYPYAIDFTFPSTMDISPEIQWVDCGAHYPSGAKYCSFNLNFTHYRNWANPSSLADDFSGLYTARVYFEDGRTEDISFGLRRNLP